MAQTTAEPLSEILVQAKMSLDSALARMKGGEEPGTLTATQLKKIQAADTNTGCTHNESCRPEGK
jgi:hypothetical protein